MAFSSINKYFASTTKIALDSYAACISAAGWEIYDHVDSDPPVYCFRSKGENNDQMWGYMHMYYYTTDVLVIVNCGGWNLDTHAPTFYQATPTYMRWRFDESDGSYIWAAANKNSIVVATNYVGNYDVAVVAYHVPFRDPCLGRLAASVTAGSSKTITLSAGDTVGFSVGEEYKIFNRANRELCTVTEVLSGSDQIVVDSLSYSYDAADRICKFPNRWYTWASEYDRAYVHEYDIEGTGNSADYSSTTDLLTYTTADPDVPQNLYALWPQVLRDCSNTGNAGVQVSDSVFRKAYVNATSEHTMSINDWDTGTVTSATSGGTLTDSTKTWGTNGAAGKVLIITAGTGAAQFYKIASNTGTVLTLTTSFVTVPDGTSEYTICDEGWMYFYFNATYAQSMALRML